MRRLTTVALMVTTAAAAPAGLGPASGPFAQAASPTITLDPSRTYQTIIGWEASSRATTMPNRDLFLPMLAELAVEAGINRIRLEISSGREHERDTLGELHAGLISQQEYNGLWYATVNDNDDSDVINWNGFHFREIDMKVDQIVNPMRRLLEARGESLFVNATYVAFTRHNAPGARYVHDRPEEYAEFVLATYIHLHQKYGWVPDTWEVILEPNNTATWNPEYIGRAMVAAARRLREAGFTPRFVAPSTARMDGAAPYFERMMSVRGVRQFVTELSYHRYQTRPQDAVRDLQRIADLAREHGVNTAMLEHIGSGHEELHQDLKVGQVSAWQQFVLAPVGPWRRGIDNGGALFVIDNSDPERPQVVTMSRTRFLRQYFKFVRRGAVRIEAATSNPAFDPVAFVHPDGGTVVVVKASSAGEFSLGNLPPGEYGVKFTTGVSYDVDAPDAVVAADGVLTAAIPAAGVLTIYRK